MYSDKSAIVTLLIIDTKGKTKKMKKIFFVLLLLFIACPAHADLEDSMTDEGTIVDKHIHISISATKPHGLTRAEFIAYGIIFIQAEGTPEKKQIFCLPKKGTKEYHCLELF